MCHAFVYIYIYTSFGINTKYTFHYNAADEGRQAESYGEKLIDFIIYILYIRKLDWLKSQK